MKAEAEKTSTKPNVKPMIENIIGCKWSLTVIDLIRRGINRPGAMQREVEGLTTKVLNERLRKLVRFEIVEKTIYPQTPPRVEYNLTRFGNEFIRILDSIEELECRFAEN